MPSMLIIVNDAGSLQNVVRIDNTHAWRVNIYFVERSWCKLSSRKLKKRMDILFPQQQQQQQNISESMDRIVHAWHGSVRPRVDDLIVIGNATVEIARELVYRTIPSYGSMVLVFATGWVVALGLSICVSCWICSRHLFSSRHNNNRHANNDLEGMVVPSAAVPSAPPQPGGNSSRSIRRHQEHQGFYPSI